MQIGTLNSVSIHTRPDLAGKPVMEMIQRLSLSGVEAVQSDPGLADTAAFCENYKISLDGSANCVIVKGIRAGEIKYAACVILATTRVDVNGLVRRHLEARKASFAPMEEAVKLTGMEYGGITPVGLPGEWPLLIDSKVADSSRLIIGSGIRGSKLIVSGEMLSNLPNALVIQNLGIKK